LVIREIFLKNKINIIKHEKTPTNMNKTRKKAVRKEGGREGGGGGERESEREVFP